MEYLIIYIFGFGWFELFCLKGFVGYGSICFLGVYCLLGYSFVIEISLVEFCDQVSGINPQAHKGLETETFKGFVVIDAVITNCTKFLGNMSECRDFGMLCRRCIY